MYVCMYVLIHACMFVFYICMYVCSYRITLILMVESFNVLGVKKKLMSKILTQCIRLTYMQTAMGRTL